MFALPLARTGLTAGAVATVARFAGSTFVPPLLLERVHLSSAAAILVLLGYSLVGIAGTLLGSRFVSRSRIGHIHVPPGVRVDTRGLGVSAGAAGEPGPPRATSAPVLHVRGSSYNGTIDVTSHPPGHPEGTPRAAVRQRT